MLCAQKVFTTPALVKSSQVLLKNTQMPRSAADNMKNKNNEKHHFLSIHLVQLEGIRHCLSPPLSPIYRASKYQKVKSIHQSLRQNLELYLHR